MSSEVGVQVGVEVDVEVDVEVGVSRTPTSLLFPLYKGVSGDSGRCWPDIMHFWPQKITGVPSYVVGDALHDGKRCLLTE